MAGDPIESFTEDRVATTKPERITEYKKRKQRYDNTKVSPGDVEALKANGWEFERSLKTGTRLRKGKSADEILENQFWSVLYLLGFEKLNVGRHFKLNVNIDGKRATKQIDVLGINADTVVVAECKSSESLRRKSLQAALADLDSEKKGIANALRALLGDNKARKIIWCMVTSKIRWNDNDLTRAKQKNIHPIRDRELRYFFEIAKTLGPAAMHQFEAEFLGGQKITQLANRTVPASRFKLGGKWAYAFTIPAKELLKRAFVNHRDLRDPSGAPTYQRLISPGRIKSVAAFLQNGGYFANSILINFHSTVRFDQLAKDDTSGTKFGMLYLPETYKSCWIIDGQHRLYGAALLDDETPDPVLSVVAFEKLPASDEAILFTTINKEQKQVIPRLLDELDGELKWDSEDPEEAVKAIAARTFDQLRHEVTGPLEDRFAPPGVPAEKGQVLTLPQLKHALVKSGLLGRRSVQKGAYIAGPLNGRTNKTTLENATSFLSAYFDAVRDANTARWDAGPPQLLCYNPAVQAHIRLCGEVVRYLEGKQKIDPHELEPEELAESVVKFCKPLFDFIAKASDEDFKERFHVPFGSGGPSKYFYKAAELINQKHADFEPEGMKEFHTGSDKNLRDECNQLVSWITDAVQSHVVNRLKEHYGDNFFSTAIKSKDIKRSAYDASLADEPNPKPLETYLNILDLKKIVEASENWGLFKDTLSIQLPEQPKSLAKYVLWFERFNEVRKIFAHPFNRTYSEEDAELLKFVEGELRKRLG